MKQTVKNKEKKSNFTLRTLKHPSIVPKQKYNVPTPIIRCNVGPNLGLQNKIYKNQT